jgi:hypothetical protein
MRRGAYCIVIVESMSGADAVLLLMGPVPSGGEQRSAEAHYNARSDDIGCNFSAC